jgi:hypothetical protein
VRPHDVADPDIPDVRAGAQLVPDIDFFIAAVPSGITAALIVCDGSFMQRLVIGEKRIFPPPPDVLKHKHFAIPRRHRTASA